MVGSAEKKVKKSRSGGKGKVKLVKTRVEAKKRKDTEKKVNKEN